MSLMQNPSAANDPESISDEMSAMVCDLLKTHTEGLPKPDRIGITLSVIANAIQGSPDLPRAAKDGLAMILCGDKLPQSRISRQHKAVMEQVRKAGKAPTANDPNADAVMELGTNLAGAIICTLLSHLDMAGWRKKDRVDDIILFALINVLFCLDSNAEGAMTQFGGACKIMHDALTHLKDTLPLAA